jgi:limonene-1,2-epoxide hydrolase
MSEENAEIIATLRGFYDAFNRRDFDAAMEMAHPEIEIVRPGGMSPLRGADALRAWMEPDAFEEQVIEPVEFTLEGDKVLVRQRMRARGAGSGIEMTVGSWAVGTVNDDGVVTRVEVFFEHEEAKALEAAGLSG